jgi:hypothetical protein
MLYSVNSLWKKYNTMADKPCALSPSCFQQIWRVYFRKKFRKFHGTSGNERVTLCFFEACHGKSQVDSMFGILTGWLDEWVKMRHLNTTEDV